VTAPSRKSAHAACRIGGAPGVTGPTIDHPDRFCASRFTTIVLEISLGEHLVGLWLGTST
jgi:hypothetical protein